MWSLLCLSLLTHVIGAERLSTVVNISQGPVLGLKDNEYDVFVFKNIPYATTPKGADRFKAPLPPPTWIEPFEVIDNEIVCPQINNTIIDLTSGFLVIQEECLIANVFVPLTKRAKLPVVVYVHGGAFALGFGNMMTPKTLVNSTKVIAVTFNYRLGAHGFLCLGTNTIPGNAGMKDQVALLRWVQDNISSFGGDPDDVTIAGFSAGSASVELLMLSKITKGLFNKVIPESGAGTAAFSIQSDPIDNAKEYAKILKFDQVDDIDAMQRFFTNISLEELNSGDSLQRPDSTFLTSPCLESHNNGESFLEEDPITILKSGKYDKLPMLYGFTNMDGMFRINLFDTWKHLIHDNFTELISSDLEFPNERIKHEVAYKIHKYYFANNQVLADTILSFVDYFTDVIFAYPTLRSVKYHVSAGHDKIYLYEYSYVDEDTPFVPHTNVKGATHCAQTFIILDGINYGDEHGMSRIQKNGEMRDTMTKIWINFITTGKPSSEDVDIPEWPPVGLDGNPYMSLNRTSSLRKYHLKERFQFWDEIYEQYYRKPKLPI